MPTRDGKEILQCERCTALDAREYTITKGDVESTRIFCDACADAVGQVYQVKSIGRAARAKKDDDGPGEAETSSRSKKPQED